MKRAPLNPGKKGLKTGKGLTSKATLKSGGKPMARGKGLKPRSPETIRKYKEERVPLVEKLLRERPWCEACAIIADYDGRVVFRVHPSSDLHEKLTRGRSGGVRSDEWLDPDNILCICRPCHNRVTEQPDIGEFLGLVAPAGVGTLEICNKIYGLRKISEKYDAVRVWQQYPGNKGKWHPRG